MYLPITSYFELLCNTDDPITSIRVSTIDVIVDESSIISDVTNNLINCMVWTLNKFKMVFYKQKRYLYQQDNFIKSNLGSQSGRYCWWVRNNW